MEDLKTWTTPLGVKLAVAGKGGPWTAITAHTASTVKTVQPLKLPIPGPGIDAGWYYRNGWAHHAKKLT